MNWIAGAIAIFTSVSRSLMNDEQRQQVERWMWLTMWGMIIGLVIMGALGLFLFWKPSQ